MQHIASRYYSTVHLFTAAMSTMTLSSSSSTHAGAAVGTAAATVVAASPERSSKNRLQHSSEAHTALPVQCGCQQTFLLRLRRHHGQRRSLLRLALVSRARPEQEFLAQCRAAAGNPQRSRSLTALQVVTIIPLYVCDRLPSLHRTEIAPGLLPPWCAAVCETSLSAHSLRNSACAECCR